ncbi:hypothetical protein [Bacillus sp. CDB3]|uniref:hypothetical protein n=1 Tax=Bacillus sp. CDB3 TaxID=360310 RepID=UPI0009D8802C|nr:hypothetical protein [Bacillus sp. CDB3]OQR55954.1 hypothetical protein CDB3_15735 [Bacillus sp. CDB3]
MTTISEITIEKAYLAQGTTDLCKLIDGLSVIVKEEVGLNTNFFLHFSESKNKVNASMLLNGIILICTENTTINC